VVILGLQQAPPPVDLFDAALREVDLATTVAHVCDTDLPAALGVLASTDLAQHVLDRVIPVSEIVEQGLVPLAEGRAGGKIVVDVDS
jgi:(R,R)-butanediol dehydrogenase/meso-butanediol dehydrogenase/diacetyl reductase